MKQILIFVILLIGLLSCEKDEFEKPNLDLDYKIEEQSIDQTKEGVVKVILSLTVWSYPGESKINTYSF